MSGDSLLRTELAPLHRADGSARFRQGDSEVLVGIFGPSNVPPKKERLDQATLEVTFHPQVGNAVKRDREIEQVLRTVLEHFVLSKLHPTTLIEVTVQELQRGGSFLSCVINATCLALLHTGVPMSETFAASCVALPQDSSSEAPPSTLDDTLALFPSLPQMEATPCQGTFVFSNRTTDIAACQLQGCLPSDAHLDLLTRAAQSASATVLEHMRSVMETYCMQKCTGKGI
eukprot:gnl/Trimastix_PCT/800.p1 GENE.gnl/Trimastix_PCT/800~~gnl/Trimastix_PCT/800.p1  ORF type:complete len:230 (+),score=34.16 gnl/Trimastix_PCT/800:54-743(+)